MSTATSALRPYGWSLRRRVTALLVVVGSVLALLAVGEALVANANRTHLDTLLTKTGPLRTDAESLPTALVDQETAVRGYAVSGDRADLAPYDEGIGQEGVLISRMDALLDDQPEIRRQLHLVRDQAERWRAEVAQPIVDATTSGGPSAGQLLVNERGRQQFDALRGSTSRLQELILDLRNEVATKARKTGNTLVLLLILAGVVVVLAGVALLVSLNRAVIGPVTRLAEQVRAVAQGDYQRDIEQTGPPELALLAADVDAMRRKIAATWPRYARRVPGSSGSTASSRSRRRSWSGPTVTWSSSPTSPRTTSRSRCARWRASASCCNAGTPASSTSAPTSTSRSPSTAPSGCSA